MENTLHLLERNHADEVDVVAVIETQSPPRMENPTVNHQILLKMPPRNL